MRITKKIAGLLAAPLAVIGVSVPATPARATPGAAICYVYTEFYFTNGIPSDPTVALSGTYYFRSATAVCAGTVTGAASVTSTGTYTTGSAFPSFTGSFSTSAFTVGGSCSGTIGGFLGNRVGTVITATLNVTCGEFPLGGTTAATGAIALDFVPLPLTINRCGGTTTDPYTCDADASGAAVLAGT